LLTCFGLPTSQQEFQLEECGAVWWLRFALDYWCTLLACGTNTGRVLLYDPHAQQARPGHGLGRGSAFPDDVAHADRSRPSDVENFALDSH
jgi:polycomb protein EED